MHELPVTEKILDIVLKHARLNHVSEIRSITLHVGGLSDLADEWIQHYFDYLSKDSIAMGAHLIIERLPIVMKCGGCDNRFAIEKSGLGEAVCPGCGKGDRLSIVSGKEYYIKEMEAV